MCMKRRFLIIVLCSVLYWSVSTLSADNSKINHLVCRAYTNMRLGYLGFAKQQFEDILKLDPANRYALHELNRYKLIEEHDRELDWYRQRIKSYENLITELHRRRDILNSEATEFKTEIETLGIAAARAREKFYYARRQKVRFKWERKLNLLNRKIELDRIRLDDTNKRLRDIEYSERDYKIGISNTEREMQAAKMKQSPVPESLKPPVQNTTEPHNNQ